MDTFYELVLGNLMNKFLVGLPVDLLICPTVFNFSYHILNHFGISYFCF